MKVTVIGGGPGGMYFAILAKKAWPEWDISIYERNKPDDTFGFGVVFSDETLGFLRDYDERSYEAIRRSFAYWDDIDIHFKGRVLRCAGNGFCGCSRITLLKLLQERCRELAITMHFQTEADDAQFPDSDLIVAADGINSGIRAKYEHEFGTRCDWKSNYFTWLGSTREMDSFAYFFRETPHGIVNAHCYQYEPARSTWVIETTADCWRKSGFGDMDEDAYIAIIADIFKDELAGHPFIKNRSVWRQFPSIRNERWSYRNIVLLGDSQHTAHWSIGSGTKLAMESAIALFESFSAKGKNVRAALAHFEAIRREDVERIQHAANVSSLPWFENVADHWHMDPEQFAFQLMSRSKQITYDNLRLRDAGFVEMCDHWFARKQREAGYDFPDGTAPMFAPLRLRGMELSNRVVMAPMAQYSATDGLPDDWHFVHYCSRALGGAGLVYTEMTCPGADARISPGCTGMWNEAQRDAWTRIVEFVHARSGAKLCMQLGHAGRKGSTRLAWDGMDLPLAGGNWPLISASPIKYRDESQLPAQMDRARMDQVRDEFVRALEFADQAGFDMVEVHMAHGYLLASFISPLTNQRSDEYGGSIENRMRYPLEVFRAMRAVWPVDKPMSVRISASDWAPGGICEHDVLALAVMLRDAGCDLINVSTGQTVSFEQPVYGRMFQVPFADKIRTRVGIPTLVAGNISSADQVNTIVMSGRSDLVALARPHLADPYFTLHAAAWYGREAQEWSKPYLSAKFQAQMLARREREQSLEMRRALRPPSHEVKEAGKPSRARDAG
ncbi:MAG: bifunctional salicylyl-CoA 5-hydroxylase/oxidoreductase [Gammaproteobacteria bacterium]|nr:bifunctional salicylyl-CoA 5-hydroxylase/oxidoreductase [Gammaproteobacteria bacterium]